MTSASQQPIGNIFNPRTMEGNYASKAVGYRSSNEAGFFVKTRSSDGYCMRDNLKRYCEMALKYGSERFALHIEQFYPKGRNSDKLFSHMAIVRYPKCSDEEYKKMYEDNDKEIKLQKLEEVEFIDISNGRMQICKFAGRAGSYYQETTNYEWLHIRLAEKNMRAILEYGENDPQFFYVMGSRIFLTGRGIWLAQNNPDIEQINNTDSNLVGLYIENIHHSYKNQHKPTTEFTITPEMDWCDIYHSRAVRPVFGSNRQDVPMGVIHTQLRTDMLAMTREDDSDISEGS